MRKKYIYILLSAFFLLFQVSCADNGDEPTPTPTPSGDEDAAVTVENLTGEWQLYYFTKQVDNGLELRYFMEDGYGTTFLPKDANGNYVFKEVDPLGQVTRTGTYFVLKDDSVRFKFKNERGIDTITAVYIGKLTTKRLVTYDKYQRRLKTQETVYDVFDVRQFRNTATAPDDLEGAKDMGAAIIADKLLGKWQVYSYLSFVNGREDPALAQLQAENIGVVYHFYKTTTGLLKFKLYNKSGVLADAGDVAIINDIIHLYFVVTENGKDVEYHLAIRTKDWGERTESGTGKKIEAFTDYIKYMSFIEGSKVPVPFEVISDIKRIE